MSDKDWTVYERHPIRLNPHTVVLIQVFTRKDNLDDLWTTGIGKDKPYVLPKNAAKQFIKQLEGQECDTFLKALIRECTRKVKSHNRKAKAV